MVKNRNNLMMNWINWAKEKISSTAAAAGISTDYRGDPANKSADSKESPWDENASSGEGVPTGGSGAWLNQRYASLLTSQAVGFMVFLVLCACGVCCFQRSRRQQQPIRSPKYYKKYRIV